MSALSKQSIGPYQIVDELGVGGMAMVWRAWDQRNQCDVAIKAIKNEYRNDSCFVKRFLDESRRQARLEHPNIVKVLDTLQVGHLQCMVMQLIEGESLEERLDRLPEKRINFEEALPIFCDILDALDYAHRKGVTHRDIKPSNILIERETGRAYLSDFGISLAIGELRHTRAHVPVGTPEYMSPEQIRTPQSIDFRSDVYSLGCVLYEALIGRPPFTAPELGGNAWEVAIRSAHVKNSPVPPHRLSHSVTKSVSKIIMWALEKDPDKRLPGCAEFARQLNASRESGASPFNKFKRILFLFTSVVVVIVGFVFLMSR